jgi:hypothetical protein
MNNARYKVVSVRGKVRNESEPIVGLGAALQAANAVKRGNRVVTILKENDGSDHPANKGKWFLDRIVK